MSVMSICIPTRNRADLLDEALGYIASLKELNYEIVISDNASTDDTAAVVMRWRPELKNLYYVRQETLIEGTENAHAVCNAARGDYIFRLSDDDRIVEEGLLAAQSLMDNNPNAVAVYPRWHVCDASLEKLSDVVHYGIEDLSPLYGLDDMANFKPHEPIRITRKDALRMYEEFWTVELPIFRREIYQRHMGGMSSQLPLDFHAAAQFLRHGDLYFIADLAALVRKHEGQESSGLHTPRILDSYSSDYELFLSRLPELDPIEAMQSYHRKLASQYLVASRIARENDDVLRAFEIVRKSLAFRIGGVEEYAYSFQAEFQANLISAFIAEVVNMTPGIKRLIMEDSTQAIKLESSIAALLPEIAIELVHTDGLINLPVSENDFVIATDFTSIQKRLEKPGTNPARHRSLDDIIECCRLV